MSDPIESLCTVLLDIAKTSPGSNINDVMAQVKSALDRNGELTTALQTDARMLQINLGQSKGYQVLVEGNATAYIGDRYEFDAEAVIQALGQLLDEIALSQSPVGTPQNLPRSGVVEFVGRDSKLKELHEQLQHNRRIAIAAVQGMGGIGKTELALQYAITQLRLGQYPAGLCWLKARDREIATDIVNFAQIHLGLKLPEQLEIDAQVAFCWQRWPEGEVLVVLDDVTDYQAIEPYLPPADPRFKLLITTRLDLGSNVQKVAIEELDEDSAIALLSSFPDVRERVRSQLADAQALCKWVGYLPLALELLGRFLARKPDWSIDRLLKALTEKRLAAKALIAPESGMTGQLGVAAALELSWQELNEAEQELACVLGMFAISPIPWSLVESCQPEVAPDDLEEIRDKGLRDRSLLKWVSEGSYQLHQIVQEYFRIKLEQRIDQGQILKSGFCQTMIGIGQNIKEPLAIDIAKDISIKIPHLEEVATQWINILSDDELSWLFLGIIRFYKSQRDYSLSESWCHHCLEITKTRCGDQHYEICYGLEELVDIYRNQGQYQESEDICLQSLNIRIETFGSMHTDVATSYNSLAGVYYDRGKYEEAELCYRKSLKIKIELLGESHSETLSVKNNLAKVLMIRGKYEEAELLLVQVIELIEGLLGKDSIKIINPMSNLAALCNNLGRYDEAEKLHKQVLDAKIKNFGKHDFRVATTMNNLALVYSNQGKYKDALLLFEKSLKISKASLDADHREIYTTIANIAKCHQDLAELTKARTLGG
jgi:tetratricopeptide (TPR) repeat protein